MPCSAESLPAVYYEAGLAYTRFTSDESDQAYGVFDKVFANLQDFGRFFAFGFAATPCVFGPILLVLGPECLKAADDIAICLRSASGAGFNRERESLTTTEQIDSLYVERSSRYPYDIRNTQELAQLFPSLRDVDAPEVSFSISDDLLPLQYIQYIRVDPYYSTRGRGIVEIVRSEIATNPRAPNIPVYERDGGGRETKPLPNPRRPSDRFRTVFSPNCGRMRAPHLSRTWAGALGPGAADQYRRAYMPYLRSGTLGPLAAADGEDPEDLPF